MIHSSHPKVAIIDYGMGNLRSVEKALQRVGADVSVIHTPEEFVQVDRIVLPGVGAFGDCMKNLERQSLVLPLKEWIRSGRPFLGICLGYQALFTESEEAPGISGLGVFEGRVVRFPESPLKVPHIGWNTMENPRWECPLLQGLPPSPYVYFVHSYYPEPRNQNLICGQTTYGTSFASMIWNQNLFACQFHPEKSQTVGLRILENFVRL